MIKTARHHIAGSSWVFTMSTRVTITCTNQIGLSRSTQQGQTLEHINIFQLQFPSLLLGWCHVNLLLNLSPSHPLKLG